MVDKSETLGFAGLKPVLQAGAGFAGTELGFFTCKAVYGFLNKKAEQCNLSENNDLKQFWNGYKDTFARTIIILVTSTTIGGYYAVKKLIEYNNNYKILLTLMEKWETSQSLLPQELRPMLTQIQKKYEYEKHGEISDTKAKKYLKSICTKTMNVVKALYRAKCAGITIQ